MTTIEAVKRAAKSEFEVIKWPLILAMLFFMASSSGALSSIEGSMFPVVAGTDITRAVKKVDGYPEYNGQTLFYGHAKKLRDCDFERIDWYVFQDGSAARVDLNIYENAKLRRNGEFTFGPWGIMLSRDELLNRSWAIVYHKCHPLFLTATRFYP